MRIYKLKLRRGTAEFEAEGDQQFVEKHLRQFSPFLRPATLPATSSSRVPARKPRKTVPPAFSAEALPSLQAYLKHAKPASKPLTAVALGTHHMQHFKSAHFTSQDVSRAASAAGIRFANLALALKAAAKQGKIRKIRKGVWSLATPKKPAPGKSTKTKTPA